MNALCIKEPWATALLLLKKKLEIRTWKTDYRGPVLITTSLQVDESFEHKYIDKHHAVIDTEYGEVTCDLGITLFIADLVDVRPMKSSDTDLSLTDYFPDSYSWELDNIQPVRKQFIKSKLRIFHVDSSLSVPLRT
jgi:hypothetical protein